MFVLLCIANVVLFRLLCAIFTFRICYVFIVILLRGRAKRQIQPKSDIFKTGVYSSRINSIKEVVLKWS